MTYNPLNNQEEDNFPNNCPIQTSDYEPDCNYYFCDKFVPTTGRNHPGLTFLSFNMCNLPCHLDTCVDQYFNVYSVPFDVLGFCETRLRDATCQLFPGSNG